MKIKIAICDDEYIHRKVLLKYVKMLFVKGSYEVVEFISGEELIGKYPNGLDIILLDIQMMGINGIETAKKIRLFDTNVTIIFTTAISEFMQEGYEVRAFRYLLKPIEYNDFSKHLSQCKSEIIKNREKYILIKEIDEGQSIIVPINTILYVEIESRITLVHTDNKTYKTRESIKNIEDELKEHSFYRCHRAYLINLHKINSIGKNNAIIKGNEVLVSRYKEKELKMKITDILGSLI